MIHINKARDKVTLGAERKSMVMSKEEKGFHFVYKTDEDIEIPPQLMFLHQGQNDMKELRFHPQFRTLLFTTAADSFNIFRPNLDPDEDEPHLEEAWPHL